MKKRSTFSKLVTIFSITAILCFGLCAAGVTDEIGGANSYATPVFAWLAGISIFVLIVLGLVRLIHGPQDEEEK